MTSWVGLHKKSVPFVSETFPISYPFSRGARHATFSYNSGVTVIVPDDLGSLGTMNSGWALAPNGNLFETSKY